MEGVERMVPVFNPSHQRYFIMDSKNNRLIQTIGEGFRTRTSCINYLNVLRRQHGLEEYEENLYLGELF